MKHAINELTLVLNIAKNNEPIQRAEGDVEQADYNKERIENISKALGVLVNISETKMVYLNDSGLVVMPTSELKKHAPITWEEYLKTSKPPSNQIEKEHDFVFDFCITHGPFIPIVSGSVHDHAKDMAETTVEELLENRAKEIYDSWSDHEGWVSWVEKGNSDKQYEARKQACVERQNETREALGMTPVTGDEPVGSIGDETRVVNYAETEYGVASEQLDAKADEIEERGMKEIESGEARRISDDDLGELDPSKACGFGEEGCASCQ